MKNIRIKLRSPIHQMMMYTSVGLLFFQVLSAHVEYALLETIVKSIIPPGHYLAGLSIPVVITVTLLILLHLGLRLAARTATATSWSFISAKSENVTGAALLRTRVISAAAVVFFLSLFLMDCLGTYYGTAHAVVKIQVEEPEYINELQAVSFYDRQIAALQSEKAGLLRDKEKLRKNREAIGYYTPNEVAAEKTISERLMLIPKELAALQDKREAELRRTRVLNNRIDEEHVEATIAASAEGKAYALGIQGFIFVLLALKNVLKIKRTREVLDKIGSGKIRLHGNETHEEIIAPKVRRKKTKTPEPIEKKKRRSKYVTEDDLRRPEPPKPDIDLAGKFWARHEQYLPIAEELAKLCDGESSTTWTALGEEVGVTHGAVKKFYGKYFKPKYRILGDELIPNRSRTVPEPPNQGPEPFPNRSRTTEPNPEPHDDEELRVSENQPHTISIMGRKVNFSKFIKGQEKIFS